MVKPDLLKLSRRMGRSFMRLMGMSWRLEYHSPQARRAGRPRGSSVFFAFWHGRQLPLLYTHRNEGVTVLVSPNRDGQYVTNVLHSMGFRTVRGSSSRGGMTAVRGMSDVLRSGRDGAITPDGPRGPARRAKTGVAYISRLGGRPVVPMGTSAWPAVRFSSWDRFLLPLPFSRVAVVEGRPMAPLKKGQDEKEWIEKLETGLNEVTAYADLRARPAPRLTEILMTAAAGALRPLACTALLFRNKRERLERGGIVECKGTARPLWLHGSSLGELKGLLPCAERLRERGIPVHITCFTPSGRKYLEKTGFSCSYLPLDIPRYVRKFLDVIQPSGLVIAETEIWPVMISRVLRRRIPCMMVNARLSRKSVRGYSLLGSFTGDLLSCFSRILTRTEDDRDRFLQLGVDGSVLRISGDTKLLADSGPPPSQWRSYYRTKKPVLIAGSTREGEEAAVLGSARAAGYFPVVAPRHLNRVEKVITAMMDSGFRPVRWSLLKHGAKGPEDFDSVVVDVHGDLAKLYGTGDAAFVGGTLAPFGGHNVLEPAMRGVPFTVGPEHQSFRKYVEEFSRCGAAYIFSSEEELTGILKRIERKSHTDPVESSVLDGIVKRIMEHFDEMLISAGLVDLYEET
ncbi:MAG: DUF374 domain-containing protein [Candidatus Aegiribacteria sp.]|nr:DUF374 domain-containing protein [Candidatus Aegiribacteria sp.]MBD3294267.1 DUF374 domain-containing protein [Candidatus Fermentibacteria bacterium]